MIEFLLVLILIFETVRLALYVQDSHNVRKMNAKIAARQQEALDFEKKRTQEWQIITRAELEELKELAKGSKFLEQILQDFQDKIIDDALPKTDSK